MNQQLKKILNEAFKAPAPSHKKEFIRRVRQPRISTFSFMLSQAAYIRKWVIGVSLIAFAVAIMGAGYLKRDMVWVLSAWMPFVAISAVTENARSVTYCMAELEMAARFSLKSVLLARMGIVGLVHLLILCLLIPFVCYQAAYSFWQTGVYLLVPYLMTTVLGFEVVRRVQGKESIYGCVGVAFFVSGMNLVLKTMIPVLYHNRVFIWWMVVLIILTIITVQEYGKVVKQTEEFVWN